MATQTTRSLAAIHKKEAHTFRCRLSFIAFRHNNRLSLCSADALLLDAGLLTGELAKVVELGTTYLTNLVHLDAVNVWRLDREDTLYTYCS